MSLQGGESMEEGGPAEGKDGSQNEDSGPESAEGTVENAQATACSANVQNSIDTKGREGREGYPLHWLVWHNDYRNLETELASGKVRIQFLLQGYTQFLLFDIIW